MIRQYIYIYCFTQYQESKSRQQQFKTGVPQGGVLSPTLFNLYTSDLPHPPAGVSLNAYADDMTPAASHSNYHAAEQLLQPYLHQQDATLNLTINNIIIPTVKNP